MVNNHIKNTGKFDLEEASTWIFANRNWPGATCSSRLARPINMCACVAHVGPAAKRYEITRFLCLGPKKGKLMHIPGFKTS